MGRSILVCICIYITCGHIYLKFVCISEKSQPEALYAYKIFMEKMKLKSLKSALTEKIDVFSLLDYIEINMVKIIEMLDEMDELLEHYDTYMNTDFKYQ